MPLEVKSQFYQEVDKVTAHPDFKGYISDLGGPSANMYKMKGKDESICERCVSPSCIHPVICNNLDTSHKSMTELYKKLMRFQPLKKLLWDQEFDTTFW